jgi:hypothetical protein
MVRRNGHSHNGLGLIAPTDCTLDFKQEPLKPFFMHSYACIQLFGRGKSMLLCHLVNHGHVMTNRYNLNGSFYVTKDNLFDLLLLSESLQLKWLRSLQDDFKVLRFKKGCGRDGQEHWQIQLRKKRLLSLLEQHVTANGR